MDARSAADPPRPGLRERKKAKTRALIQAHAVRLFVEQGYDETSIEQIAEAAEVSPSTVFRYFPTKADLVIYDELDDVLIAAYRAQDPGRGVVGALRDAMRSAFGSFTREDIALQVERATLLTTVPELRSAMLDELVRTMHEIAGLIAERSGRSVDDDEVVALAGAVIGVSIGAWFGAGGGDWTERFVERIDAGMALLESGSRI
jgi:AcrR family transcriptional regulator